MVEGRLSNCSVGELPQEPWRTIAQFRHDVLFLVVSLATHQDGSQHRYQAAPWLKLLGVSFCVCVCVCVDMKAEREANQTFSCNAPRWVTAQVSGRPMA